MSRPYVPRATQPSLPGLLAFLILTAPAMAGVVFEVETTDHSGSSRSVQTSQIAVQGRSMKMDIKSADSSEPGAMIFRGARREMVVVDHRGKTYMVLGADLIQSLGGQMQEVMSQLEKALENVPKEQRAMVEKMMKERMGNVANARGEESTTEYRETGERATREGYPCVRWEAVQDGEKTLELWVTDWDELKGAREAMQVFNDMSEFYRELMAGIEKMASGLGGIGLGEAEGPLGAVHRISGFPVVTRHFQNGDLKRETVLRSVTQRDLDSTTFEPPKDYRLRTMGPQ